MIYYIFIFIALIIFNIWIFWKLSRWSIVDRLLASVTSVLLFISANAVLIGILKCPFNEWCHNRLVPAFALSNGYKFFNALESGPVLTWLYGPMTAISYLPATLAHSPTNALSIAVLLGIFFFFTPILLFSFKSISAHKSISFKSIVFSLFIFFGSFLLVIAKYDNLAASAFIIHADAPSLGLAGSACAVLYFRKSSSSFIPLLLSASLAILAIWTKQNLLTLPLALLTYVVIADGYKVFKRYLLCFLLSGTLISILFLCFFSFNYLYFTMFEWPASWPWSSDPGGTIPSVYTNIIERLKALSFATYELIRYSLLLVGIIAFYAVYHLKYNRYNSLREYFLCNRWIILVLVSVYTSPIAVLSRVKLGGGTYSLAVSLYFLLCTVTAIATSILIATPKDSKQSSQSKWIKLCALLAIVVFTFRVFKTEYSPVKSLELIAKFFHNPVELAYRYDKEHPGQVYFPDIPLAAIMAEGKLYHSTLGLFDRRFYESVNYNYSPNLIDKNLIEKFEIKGKRFKENIPPNLKFVALLKGRETIENSKAMNSMLMSQLPDFSKQTTISTLPGWIVFSK